jgi:hypothetical protein
MRQRWEWLVGAGVPQRIVVELSLLSAREVVRVDGETIVDKNVWSFRTEYPLELNNRSGGIVHVSLGRLLLPKCELEVDGAKVAPIAGPTYSGFRRLLAATVPLLLVILVPFARPAWMAAHRVLGGVEVPAPAWDEADLLPLPPEDQNAWYRMGKYSQIPYCDFESVLQAPDRPIPADMTEVVAMGLSLPEVQELLERTEGIYESNRLANPNAVAPPFSSSGAHRIGAWHSWVQLSWMQEAMHAPSNVAFKIARVIPMWIECANTSREELTYELCLRGLISDLRLAKHLASRLDCADCAKGRAALSAAVRDAPKIDSDNLRIAMYLTAYARLSEFVDFDDSKRRQLMDINGSFKSLLVHFSEPLEVPCEGLVEPLGFWDYNAGGLTKVRNLTNARCKIAPKSETYLSQVADHRREILGVLAMP